MDDHPPASPTGEPGSPDKVGVESVKEQPAVRRLWWVWSLLALVVLTVGAFAATRSVLLDVDEVLVDGVGDRLDRLLVVEMSGIRTGEPMVEVSPEAAAHRGLLLGCILPHGDRWVWVQIGESRRAAESRRPWRGAAESANPAMAGRKF